MEHAIQESIFTELYRKHYKELVSFVYSRIEHWQDAEDIVSNLFLRIPSFLNEEQKSSISILKAYFYTSAKHKCTDYENGRKRKALTYNSEVIDDYIGVYEETKVEEKEVVETFLKIQEIMSSLSERSLYILKKLCMENVPTHVLAQELGITNQTVLNMKTIALNKIRGVINSASKELSDKIRHPDEKTLKNSSRRRYNAQRRERRRLKREAKINNKP